MMKQHIVDKTFEREHCPVHCPVCKYEGAIYPVHFEHSVLALNETVDRPSNRANLILFLIEGSLFIQLGNKEIYIHSAQALFFRRSTRLCVRATKNSEIIWMDFSNRIILGDNDLLRINTTYAIVKEEAYPVLDLKGRLLERLRQMSPLDNPCYHLNLQYELYMLMKYEYTNEEVTRFFRPILQANDDFQAFIIENYRYGDTLKEIAGKANLSLSHFLRRFKMEFGMTAHQWLMKQKAERLIHAIGAGQRDSKILAEQFGFSSPAGLYIFCSRQIGKSFKRLIKESVAGKSQALSSTNNNGDFRAKKDNFR